MKQLLILSLLVICTLHAAAQSREILPNDLDLKGKKLTLVGFKIGVGLPFSEFASKDVLDEKAGLAKPGIALAADLRYFVSKSFYLLAEGKFNSNPIEEDVFINSITGQFGTNLNPTISSSNWNTRSLLVGVGTETPISSDAFFYTKFALGLTGSSSPSINTSISDGRNSASVSQTSGKSSKVGLSLGGGVRIQSNEKTNIHLGADYLLGYHEYFDIIVTENVNRATVGSTTINYAQRIDLLTLYFGLTFKM